MPEKDSGPLSGEVAIPGTQTKVPKVLVLALGVAGVVALYLATKGQPSASSDLGGGIASPNGETVGGAGAGSDTTGTDNTAIMDALNQQSQTLQSLISAIQSSPQTLVPPSYPAEVPYTDSGGGYVPSQAMDTLPGYALDNSPALASPNLSLSAVNVPQERPNAAKASAPAPVVEQARPSAAKAASSPTPAVEQARPSASKASAPATPALVTSSPVAKTTSNAPKASAPAPVAQSKPNAGKASAPAASGGKSTANAGKGGKAS
jgi:hypothetical protein